MQAEETVRQWDAIVQAALTRPKENTTESRPSSAAIPLRKEPKQDHLSTVRRDIAKITPNVRSAFRDAFAGNATWPMFMFGPAGTGKTCAALCLLDHVGGWYRELPELCQELIDIEFGRKYSEGAENEGGGRKIFPDGFWKGYARQPLVVLDEIGCRDRVSDQHYQTLKSALDKRAGRPLIVLSNLTLGRIEKLYDDRIASRLGAGTVIELGGADRRIQAA